MVFCDNLGNVLNEIKKGQKERKLVVRGRKSKFINQVLLKLLDQGFIYGFAVVESHFIKIFLKYGLSGAPLIKDIKRVSKISRRVYVKVNDLQDLKSRADNSVFFLTTAQGILTDKEALQLNIGGEVLFQII